jgi:hypothetical protein
MHWNQARGENAEGLTNGKNKQTRRLGRDIGSSIKNFWQAEKSPARKTGLSSTT